HSRARRRACRRASHAGLRCGDLEDAWRNAPAADFCLRARIRDARPDHGSDRNRRRHARGRVCREGSDAVLVRVRGYDRASRRFVFGAAHRAVRPCRNLARFRTKTGFCAAKPLILALFSVFPTFPFIHLPVGNRLPILPRERGCYQTGPTRENKAMSDYKTTPAARYGQTARAGVEVDQGLRAYMLRVYNYMAMGLAMTGAAALGTFLMAVDRSGGTAKLTA